MISPYSELADTIFGKSRSEYELKRMSQEELLETALQMNHDLKFFRSLYENNIPACVNWLYAKVYRQRLAILGMEKRGKGHTKEEREQLKN